MSTIKRAETINQEIEVRAIDVMSFTEQFFTFPCTMYVQSDIQKSEELENLGIQGVHSVPEGVVGEVRCLAEDIVLWHDSFSAPRSIDEVKRHGFDMTNVQLRNGEEFTCIWPRSKFEKKLNDHVQKIQDKMFKQVDEKFKESLNGIIEEQEQKRANIPWYKKIFK